MVQISLFENLCKNKMLYSNIKATSLLIKEMEIYGYINTWGDDLSNIDVNMLCGVVNKHSANQIVCSDFLYQEIYCSENGNMMSARPIITPIYKSIKVCETGTSMNIKDLYIPYFIHNQTYLKIKSRFGKGVTVSHSEINNLSNPFFEVYELSGNAFMRIKKGDVLFYDQWHLLRSVENVLFYETDRTKKIYNIWIEQFGKEEAEKMQGSPKTKGILFHESTMGKNIIVICRYLHDKTGNMCYALFNLEEVYVEEEIE